MEFNIVPDYKNLKELPLILQKESDNQYERLKGSFHLSSLLYLMQDLNLKRLLHYLTLLQTPFSPIQRSVLSFYSLEL